MKPYKNILIVRTDRIGDVVLTTPAIEAVRSAFPAARISILVTPETRQIVDGNPSLNEVLIDDKKGVHKGLGFFSLIAILRRKKFDLAIIFHTKKRANLLCFLAGIPARIGYKNDKFGFLLTQPIADTRSQGSKHEAQYCLDLLESIGVHADNLKSNLKLSIPVKEESQKWAATFLRENNIKESDRFVVIHPGASCVSKRWPAENFSKVVKKLAQSGNKVFLIGGEETKNISAQILKNAPNAASDLSGSLSLSQLAALLAKSQLLISNDSGPVHMAAAVGAPVISIFGRNQAGLSPARWKPLGARDIVLHKEVGCNICLAHNCVVGFECLKAITPEEVLEAVEKILAS